MREEHPPRPGGDATFSAQEVSRLRERFALDPDGWALLNALECEQAAHAQTREALQELLYHGDRAPLEVLRAAKRAAFPETAARIDSLEGRRQLKQLKENR